MYCKYCGQQIDDNAQFCPYCGKQLGEANNGYTKQGNSKQKKRKKTPRRVWPWLVCLMLFVIATIALLFALSNRNMDNTHVSVRSDDGLYTPDENSIETDKETGISFVNNMVIIFFQPDTDQGLIDDTIVSIEGEVVGRLDFIDQYQVRIPRHSLKELTEICEDLEEQEHVISAIYDEAFLLDPDVIPDDPWAGHWWSPQQWSQETPDGANWWAEVINAPDAWDYNSYYSNIKIGVIDNGFDIGHEDLKNVIKSVSLNNDSQGHGTHVSGIIGAEANNNKGITGIVWNCSILASDWELNTVQKIADFFDGQNWSTTTQILGGVSVLVKEGAKIVNISAGQSGSMKGTTRSKAEIDYQGYNASMYLCALLSKGYDFVVVQSAGNGNESGMSVDTVNNGLFCSVNEANCVHYGGISTKDIIDRIIVVGAAERDSDNKYTQCSFSNAGNRVDICAPGKDIYSTVPGGWSGKYESLDGTSMAAPIVTGVAALVWAANPKLKGDEVKGIVCCKEYTKYDVSDSTSSKHPLVNTYRMVNASLAVQAAIVLLDRPTDEVWEIITEEENTENDDVSVAVPESLENMHDPIYVFTFNNHLANQHNYDLLSNPYSFWSTIALYATIKAYDETENGENKIAEIYRSDETGEVVVLSDQAVMDVVNALFPSIPSLPNLPESQYETFLHRDGYYYLPLIDLDTESCRIKKIVPKGSGAEAIAEIFSYTDDHAYAVYRLTLAKNDKVNTESPEPYYYCIKNAELIDEPVKEYEELIEEYEIAIGDYSLLQNDPDGFTNKYSLVNTDVIRRMHDYPDLYLFTAYKDINNDGVTELLISLGNYDYQSISGIYTRYSKKVIPLLADIDELSTVTVYDDGTIWAYKQGLYGLETIYKIGKDGRSLDVIAQYETDWENYPDYPYSDGKNRISLQQFQEKYLNNKEEQYFKWDKQMESEGEPPAAAVYYNSAYGIVGEWISESGTEKYKFTNSPQTGALPNASGYVEYWDLGRYGRLYGDYRLDGDIISIWFTNKGALYSYSYNLHSETGVLDIDGTSFNYISDTGSILDQLYGTWISGDDVLTFYGANGAPHQYALDRYSNSDLNGNYCVWDSTHIAINNDIMNYEQMWLV